jgi:hypothetical protein
MQPLLPGTLAGLRRSPKRAINTKRRLIVRARRKTLRLSIARTRKGLSDPAVIAVAIRTISCDAGKNALKSRLSCALAGGRRRRSTPRHLIISAATPSACGLGDAAQSMAMRGRTPLESVFNLYRYNQSNQLTTDGPKDCELNIFQSYIENPPGNHRQRVHWTPPPNSASS